MIVCDYKYKGEIITREELYKMLSKSEVSRNTKVSDVLFSRADKLKHRADILSAIKSSGIVDNGSKSLIDGDISFKGEDGSYSISSFVDSPFVDIDLSVYRLREIEDYKLEQFKYLTLKKGYSVELANKLIENNIKNWDKITEDCRILHKLCVDTTIGFHEREWDSKRLEFVNKALTLISEDSPLNDINLLRKLYDIFAISYRNAKGQSDSVAFRNLGLKAKIIDLDFEIFGHIDYVFVDTSGKLHIFNFKMSSLDPEDWSIDKIKKFKLEGAFLKQILIANGINVKNIDEITYHTIPIILNYNDDFTKINSVHRLPTDILLDFKKGIYTFKPYDDVARKYVDIPFELGSIDDNDFKKLTDSILEYSFPLMKISSDRIYKSTLDWIKEAPSVSSTESLIIKEVNEPDCRYRVILFGKTYDIKDFTKKENNQEIISIVRKHLNRLNAELGDYSSKISTAVEKAFKHKLHFLDNVYNSSFASRVLSKYLPIDKEHDSDWKLNTELIEYNILLFKNTKSGQVDVVTITSEDLLQEGDFRKGAHNILGSYKYDGNKDASTLKGDMGNVELIRGLILLNQILPSLDSPKLGEITVLSTARNGLSRRHYILDFNNKYFNHFLQIVKQENGEELKDVVNNFNKANYTDPFDDVIREYQNLTESLDSARKYEFDLMGFKDLSSVEQESKIGALFDLLKKLSNSKFLSGHSVEEIYNIAHPRQGSSSGTQEQIAAKLYELISRTYLYYLGESVLYGNNMSGIDTYSFTAPTIPDYNVRIVVNNMQTTLDSIAYEENKEYEKNISPIVMEYYKACGYTNVLNLVVGNQLHLFDNLYQTDANGNKLMIFKNPYDESQDLKPHERIFLKKVLFYLNKVRFKDRQKFTSYNDPDIPKYINNDKEGERYLWVPLTRASRPTKRQLDISDRVERIKRAFRIATKTNGKAWFDEVISEMTLLEREEMNKNMESLSLTNPFTLTERNLDRRQDFINKEGVSFFETNVENIMIEYMAKSIETEKLNTFLVGTKSLLLQLHIMGNDSDEAKKIVEKELELIKKYITLNVFNTSTMGKNEQKLVAATAKLRKATTFSNLAGNIISFFRDTINGFMENFLRASTKFLTDIKAKSLKDAYLYVFVNGRSDAMNINLLSKLNIRYRLSNTDLARIKERLRTGRNGVYNWDNWAYSTLRSPDFLNRMTLFVARCMQDGVWDAYSLENGELKYDVRKDKRFLHFINDDVKHPDYAKEKALFILHVKNWNKEHPSKDNPLDWSKKELPEPYSDLEILAIKNVANNIYGSYDKSLKAQYEQTALGYFFTMYTTWMNGIWNNWAMKPGEYNIHNMTTEIQKDENGNNMYMEDNGNFVTEIIEGDSKKYIDMNGNEISSLGLTPVLKLVPVITQGIWYTLKDAFLVLRKDGVSATYKYIQSNEVDKRNINQLWKQLAIALLFALLFNAALTPAYKDSKKKSSNLNLAEKLAMSITYRSLNGARDSFAGPLNVIEYFGENMNPPMYKVPIKLLKDSGNALLGKKSIEQVITGNIAVARTFRDII